MFRSLKIVVATALTVAAVFLTACQGSTQPPTASSPPSEPTAPAGLIALGHSGLTGENADPARQGQEARDQSWATGDDPAVESIYLRMVAEDPIHDGRVSNTAKAGGPSVDLPSQAEQALTQVPMPALAIIQTIDNDIRCDGTDPEHVAEFGANVRAALEVITEASPETKILLVSQRGRPAMIHQLIPEEGPDPAPGDETCEFVNSQGQWIEANASYLTDIIEAYEAEQERVCAEFENCSDDGGANATFEDSEEDLEGGDGNHLTTKGQARTAALLWPVVAEVLGY